MKIASARRVNKLLTIAGKIHYSSKTWSNGQSFVILVSVLILLGGGAYMTMGFKMFRSNETKSRVQILTDDL